MDIASDIEAGREIGSAIRVGRKERGLSQVQVSASIGVSRSTLDHIERFDGRHDVGVVKFIAAARVVGLHLHALSDNPAMLAQEAEQARAAQGVANLRERHYRLAALLAISNPAAIAQLENARRMVVLWRKNKICGEEFIEAWGNIVREDPPLAAKKILEISQDWINAMFQNTPFALGAPG